MNNSDRAECLFKEGFACSQALFATFSEQLGLHRGIALKTADAFGAGMGGMAETCGAVTGAIMVIGLKYGREVPGDDGAREKTREFVKEFVDEFKSRHHSIICKELLDSDISTAEGMESANKQGLFKTRCPNFIRDAAGIVEQLL